MLLKYLAHHIGIQMNKEQRKEWLGGLFENQIRALASQYKIEGAMFKSRGELISMLASIEGVEVPKRG